MSIGKALVLAVIATGVSSCIYFSGKLEARKEINLYEEGYTDGLKRAEEIIENCKKKDENEEK